MHHDETSIDAHARSDPEVLSASVPHSADATKNFAKNHSERASQRRQRHHRVVRVDRENDLSDNFETLAYMCATDIRYTILSFAACACTNFWCLRQGVRYLVMFSLNGIQMH